MLKRLNIHVDRNLKTEQSRNPIEIIFETIVLIHLGILLFSHLETSIQLRNNNKKFRSFKSEENIHKKEVGPYHGSAIKTSPLTL